jgi:hypothetical protein
LDDHSQEKVMAQRLEMHTLALREVRTATINALQNVLVPVHLQVRHVLVVLLLMMSMAMLLRMRATHEQHGRVA